MIDGANRLTKLTLERVGKGWEIEGEAKPENTMVRWEGGLTLADALDKIRSEISTVALTPTGTLAPVEPETIDLQVSQGDIEDVYVSQDPDAILRALIDPDSVKLTEEQREK